MLRNIKALQNCAIGATDGAIGHVKDFYFDDETWVIRYLVVETGSWLDSRQVLISPTSISQPDWAQKLLPVSITREQVRQSPDIDTDKPVSRQHEADYHSYYGYPYYWGRGDGPRDAARHRRDDPHLRSCAAVAGYHLHATDGEIGHLESLFVDDKTWTILYLVVNTSNWWRGHKVLIAPAWIQEVSWADSRVSVKVTRQTVQDAPTYDPDKPLDHQHEMQLYKHYGRPGYWADAEILETDIVRI